LADIHITRDLLRAVARGDLPPRVVVELGIEHLTSLCATCREEYLAFKKGESSRADYDTAFKVLPLLLDRHLEDVSDQYERALRDLKQLLRLPSEERRRTIDRANSRFRGTFLAGMLLDESKKLMAIDVPRALELAETAEAVLCRTPQGPDVGGLVARAAAYMANAYRRLDNYQEARRWFAFARSTIRFQGVTDPQIYAEIDSAEAVFHIDQRRFREAEELLGRSIALYALAGAKAEAAHPLLTLGILHGNRGRYRKAIATTRTALEHIDPKYDRRLYISARFNLALFLCEDGDHGKAAETLERDRDLFRDFPDLYTQLRLVWLEGKIASGFGDFRYAEEAFRSTREGFILHRHGYDAAMASLDLALVYAREERMGEMKQLAEEMHEIFSSDGVHREAIAALLLFEEAARQEVLTVEAIEEVADYLKRARGNPSLRFRKKLAP
jgi:tetratricopeptide (TPR) repeat protein